MPPRYPPGSRPGDDVEYPHLVIRELHTLADIRDQDVQRNFSRSRGNIRHEMPSGKTILGGEERATQLERRGDPIRAEPDGGEAAANRPSISSVRPKLGDRETVRALSERPEKAIDQNPRPKVKGAPSCCKFAFYNDFNRRFRIRSPASILRQDHLVTP
jgi:hypothetical protein